MRLISSAGECGDRLQREPRFWEAGREKRPRRLGAELYCFDAHDVGEAGDQRAGYDITLTFLSPSRSAYTEGAAEDSVHLPNSGLSLGLYLPGCLTPRGWNCGSNGPKRMTGTSHTGTHHVYTAGYTYKNMSSAHMGTNARDTFAS